ncbi:MAG: MFS transporter [Acidimicrobiia bacterium]|nr:MFS transporter [Acidimicrobiia bacterium]
MAEDLDADAGSQQKRKRFGRTELTLFGLIFALSVGEGGARFLSPVYLADNGSAVGSIGLALSVFGASALAARFLIGSTFRASSVRLTIAISALASTASLYLITFTSSITAFTLLIGVHGVGWGVLATVLLTLIMSGKDTRSAAAVIGFYVGIEGLGRTGSPILAGILGGAFGPSTGMRIHTTLFAVTAIVGISLLSDAPTPAVAEPGSQPTTRRRFDLTRFRHVPLAAWVAALTGFYLNTTNALLNTFFPLLGLTLGFSLGQIGTLAGSRSAVSALIRFVAHRAFDRIPFAVQFIPLYLLNAITASLIGVVTIYPAQFFLFMPNGASRGVLRVGSMAQAMEDSDEGKASATAALIGAGYDVGRIVGPLVGGLVATAVGLSTMFVALPLIFVVVILPMALWARRGPRLAPDGE